VLPRGGADSHGLPVLLPGVDPWADHKARSLLPAPWEVSNRYLLPPSMNIARNTTNPFHCQVSELLVLHPRLHQGGGAAPLTLPGVGDPLAHVAPSPPPPKQLRSRCSHNPKNQSPSQLLLPPPTPTSTKLLAAPRTPSTALQQSSWSLHPPSKTPCSAPGGAHPPSDEQGIWVKKILPVMGGGGGHLNAQLED